MEYVMSWSDALIFHHDLPFIPLHYTFVPFTSSPKFTSLHCIFWWFPPHLHFTLFIAFLILFVKLLSLRDRLPEASVLSTTARRNTPSVKVNSHRFYISVLDESEWLASLASVTHLKEPLGYSTQKNSKAGLWKRASYPKRILRMVQVLQIEHKQDPTLASCFRAGTLIL
jgi:hypothetical protein